MNSGKFMAVSAIKASLHASEIITEYLGEPLPASTSSCPVRSFHPIEKRVYHAFVNHIIKDRPILFLDIDGVLNLQSENETELENYRVTFMQAQAQLFPNIQCNKYQNARIASECLSKEAVTNLRQFLTSQPETAIVLSSDWRKDHSLLAIRCIFESHGFGPYIIDKTKNSLAQIKIDLLCAEQETCIDAKTMRHFCYRGTYIKHWLEKHPTCRNYAIFDDMHQGSTFGDRFIYVNPRTLLTLKHIESVSKILTQSPPSQNENRQFSSKERVTYLRSIKALSTTEAKKAFFYLAEYENSEELMKAAELTAQKLTQDQKSILCLVLLKKKGGEKFFPILFHHSFDPPVMAKILWKLFQNQDTRPLVRLLLEKTGIPSYKKSVIFSTLLNKKNSSPFLKCLLTYGEIDNSSKSYALKKLIGHEGLAFLAFREKDISSTIKELVDEQFSGNKEVEELIHFLLVDGDITSVDRGVIFQELSDEYGNEDKLAFLLKKGVAKYYLEESLYNLSNIGSNEIIKQILLQEKIEPFAKGIVLVNLCKIDGSDELIKFLVEDLSIFSDDLNTALCNLAIRGGTDELMLLILNHENITLVTKFTCLIAVAKRNCDKRVIHALCGGIQATARERGILLENFAKTVEGTRKEIEIINLLLYGIPEEGENVSVHLPPIPIEDKVKKDTLIQLARKRAVVTESSQMFWLDQFIKDLLSKNSFSTEYAQRLYPFIAKGKNIKDLMIFLNEKYTIKPEYKDLAVSFLLDNPEKATFQWFLESYKNELSPDTKGYILRTLAVRGDTVLMEVLINDNTISDRDKQSARKLLLERNHPNNIDFV